RSPAEHASAQPHVGLHGRRGARVEHLARAHGADAKVLAHNVCTRSKSWGTAVIVPRRMATPSARALARPAASRYSAGDLPSTRATSRHPACRSAPPATLSAARLLRVSV